MDVRDAVDLKDAEEARDLVTLEELDAGPDLVIITGMSGAGRTEAMHTFEDLGFFCIDNLPPSLLINLVSLANLPDGGRRKLAVVCDLRAKEFFADLADELAHIAEIDLDYSVLFLDSRDEVLLARFKETRRRHPLAEPGMTIISGILKEREQLAGARELADHIVDTSEMRPQDLREAIRGLFSSEGDQEGLGVSVFSFGFKHGMPLDTDIVIDVRFLPNPFYDPALRTCTGLDQAVQDFVLSQPATQEFLERWFALLDTLMPGYVNEGKAYLSIGIGCTGGQHRSVVIAQQTANYLREKGYRTAITHRDIAMAEVV